MRIVQSGSFQHSTNKRFLFALISRGKAIEKSGNHWMYSDYTLSYFSTFKLEFK